MTNTQSFLKVKMMKMQDQLDYKVIAVIDALEHYFVQTEYRDGFCMCHALPKIDKDQRLSGAIDPGHSWEEHFGLTRRVFNQRFDVIGIRYPSKTQYLAQADPFDDRLYASYYDRKMNRLYYKRNHAIADLFLKAKAKGKTLQNMPYKTEERFMVM